MSNTERNEDGRVRGRVGRPSRYRGKVRSKPIQMYLTRDGLLALEAGCLHNDMARPEYVESLLMKAATGIPNWRQVGGRAFQLKGMQIEAVE